MRLVALDYVLNMPVQDMPRFVAIIDDDVSVRRALQDLMDESGFATFACASAEEFLQSHNKQNIACLVTDIRMPGMSGLELQSRLNADHRSIPIIFLTAHGDEDCRLQAMRAGAVEFMTKPFDEEVLLECVRAALSR